MLAWRVGDIATASDRLDSAERILDGLEPSEEHARLLHARVVASVRLGNVDAVRMAAQEAIDANPAVVEDFRGGKQAAIGRLIGETMKRTGGRARPDAVRATLLELLS